MPWRTAARIAFGAALLVAVFIALDPAEVLDTLASADLRLAIPAVLGLTAMHAVVAGGWRWMIRQRTGLRLTWASTLRAHYAAQAVGSVTPGNLGGDVHRAAALRRAGHDWPAAVEPIVVQRATSYLALSLLAGIGLAVLSTTSSVGGAIVLIGAVAAVALVGAAWLLLVPIGPTARIHHWLRSWTGGTAADASGSVAALSPARASRLMLGGIINGLAFHAGSIFLTWLLVLATDPSSPSWPMLAAIAVARLSLAIPLSPSGLGIQEGTLAALVAGMQLAPQAALAAMLFARISTLLLALVGVALMLRGTPRLQPVGPAAALPATTRR
jgi:glycosyltransferase 2 family protein